MSYKMAIALRQQICDVTSPYVYTKLGGLGTEVPQWVQGEAPAEDQGEGVDRAQKLKKLVTDTLNFEANCKEIMKIKIIIL